MLARAYGMSDLERETPNTVDTVFEAGSVSKQFTAAAVMLLARDGKLSLDDPVRKHIPELPDYGAPLTIRQMLTHTSGLRDWGALFAAAGWPRGTRVHTLGHVLGVLSRQKALNFPSGTEYSYSNSGYNLAAILVSRVAGKPFADFTRERIFVPLGMTRTEWRDDHHRIVKGRATAYTKGDAGWRIEMPFENVHGQGGLLTTVARPAALERGAGRGHAGGTGFRRGGAATRRPGRREADPLRDGPLRRHVARHPRGEPRRSDRRLPCRPRPVSRPRPLRRRVVQRRQRQREPADPPGGRGLPRRPARRRRALPLPRRRSRRAS